MGAIFLSYSHVDETWMRRVTTQLGTIPKSAVAEVWADTAIGVGDDWRDQIASAITRATAAVMLVSPDFLVSRFVVDQEIPQILQAAISRGLRIVPVLVRPCMFEVVPWIEKRQLRPRNLQALSTKADHEIDTALTELARELTRISAGSALTLKSTLPPALAAPPQTPELDSLRSNNPVQYFFYLAKDRISNLFNQLPLDQQESASTLRLNLNASENDHTRTNDLNVATTRLPVVTNAIEKTSRVGHLLLVAQNRLEFDFDWYLVDTTFRCQIWARDDHFVIFDAEVAGYHLQLACAKTNLLSVVKEDDTFIPTSASYFVFEKAAPVRLKGLVRIVSVDRTRREIMGSPLYLQLGTNVSAG